MIDLRHEDCGGWFHPFATKGEIGGGIQYFMCEKCGATEQTKAGDEESIERRHKKDKELYDRMDAVFREKNTNSPPAPKHFATKREALILGAYQWWSEDFYAAGFIDPKTNADKFMRYMELLPIYEYYEEELLSLTSDWAKDI